MKTAFGMMVFGVALIVACTTAFAFSGGAFRLDFRQTEFNSQTGESRTSELLIAKETAPPGILDRLIAAVQEVFVGRNGVDGPSSIPTASKSACGGKRNFRCRPIEAAHQSDEEPATLNRGPANDLKDADQTQKNSVAGNGDSRDMTINHDGHGRTGATVRLNQVTYHHSATTLSALNVEVAREAAGLTGAEDHPPRACSAASQAVAMNFEAAAGIPAAGTGANTAAARSNAVVTDVHAMAFAAREARRNGGSVRPESGSVRRLPSVRRATVQQPDDPSYDFFATQVRSTSHIVPVVNEWRMTAPASFSETHSERIIIHYRETTFEEVVMTGVR